MKTVCIVHGYSASPQRHWFPWLSQELEALGIRVVALSMPDPQAPDVKQWDQYLDMHLPRPDEDTVLLGHSLGCITLLRYLSRHAEVKSLCGLALVSGFYTPVAAFPELDLFAREIPDFERIKRLTSNRAVITARNDGVVPCAMSCNLAEQLQSDLYILHQGGHFLDSEGVMKFPLVLHGLKEMLKPS